MSQNKYHRWSIHVGYEECSVCGIRRRVVFNTLSAYRLIKGHSYTEYFINGEWVRNNGNKDNKFCKPTTTHPQQ